MRVYIYGNYVVSYQMQQSENKDFFFYKKVIST